MQLDLFAHLSAQSQNQRLWIIDLGGLEIGNNISFQTVSEGRGLERCWTWEDRGWRER